MTKENQKQIVTRFAPSPTGFMHIGGVRTALFAWIFARKNNGKFILRIEDTDKEREVPGSIEHIIESLNWLGLNWDEGPNIGGPKAPYIQSERLEIYKKYAQTLADKGLAYADPYSKEEIQAFRETAEKEKRPFSYREHRPENPPVWDGSTPLRFKITNVEKTKWHDLVRGDLEAGPEALDDFILIKSDGYPTYNFAHIIDDFEMGVTHIFRADEFISSTPNFIALYNALEITRPEFVTLPPIMGPDGKKKLSKRDGAKDILEYRNEGYLPDAIFNFLAFIGWNPGAGDDREIFSRKEIIELFKIEKIQTGGANLNEEKLLWVNKEHIKRMPQNDFISSVRKILNEFPIFANADELLLKKISPLILERIETFGDLRKMISNGELDYFINKPVLIKEKIIWKDSDAQKTKEYLEDAIKIIESISDSNFDAENIKEYIWDYATEKGRGVVLWPIRYSLSGKDKSPDPFSLISILGKKESIARIKEAISIL
ncbi:MAG: glutamate--tRNA ligase [Candidatus Paceibacterota bacterium]